LQSYSNHQQKQNYSAIKKQQLGRTTRSMVDPSKRLVNFERLETHPGTLPTTIRNLYSYYVHSKTKEMATMMATAPVFFFEMVQLLAREMQKYRLVQVSLQPRRRNQSLRLV
jgi:hypothetical protein